jgi:hypothetical protein
MQRKPISHHWASRGKYKTIQEYAQKLIQLVHFRDEDGRDIGYDYGLIHAAILRKFPIVKSTGPHKGKPTKMPYKELWEISCELNRNGVKLPFRPRRRNSAKKKSRS